MSSDREPIRGRFKWDEKKRKMIRLVEKKRAAAAPVAPAYIGDEMTPAEIGGKTYTSKSRFAAEVKAHGYELTGGENPVSSSSRKSQAQKEEEIRADLEKAYYMVRDGNAPLSEKERERCKRQNEILKRGE